MVLSLVDSPQTRGAVLADFRQKINKFISESKPHLPPSGELSTCDDPGIIQEEDDSSPEENATSESMQAEEGGPNASTMQSEFA